MPLILVPSYKKKSSSGIEGAPGSHATFDPVKKSSDMTLSLSNTRAQNVTNNWRTALATKGFSSGKHYWEFTSPFNSNTMLGISLVPNTYESHLGDISNSIGFRSNSLYSNIGQQGQSVSILVGAAIAIAINMDIGCMFVSVNGVWQNGANPSNHASTTGALMINLPAQFFFPAISSAGVGNGATINFGATGFAYPVPDGFNAGVF